MANGTNTTIQTDKNKPPIHYLSTLQAMINNELYDVAAQKIKDWGLKIEIHNGKLVDMSDTTQVWLNKFITIHPQTMLLKDKILKLAKVDDEVLITGDSGTGKELLAHALHGERSGRFIGLNCAGIPENLVESLLFGHTKGSFTGATMDKIGYMTMAKEGTLFLDEIGELPINSQAKLLRAIQERKIMKIGSEKEEDINCRIVCATHRDLWMMTQTNTFRLDLFARLSTFELDIPPLWRRPCDIEPILLSLEGGEILLNKLRQNEHPLFVETNQIRIREIIPLNVRSLQQMVRRYKILGEMS